MFFASPPSSRLPPDPRGQPPTLQKPRLEELRIDTGWHRRWLGIAGYVLFFAFVAALLVYLFFQFTDSLKLAFVLVVFMITYMVLMGWLAARKNAGEHGNLE